jgi:hypothetical protein
MQLLLERTQKCSVNFFPKHIRHLWTLLVSSRCHDMTLPRLPVEILDSTFRALSRHELGNISQVSKTFCAISKPILYWSIKFELEPRRCILLLKCLHENASNSSLVHDLDLDSSNCDLTGNFYRLLNRTLRRLTSLVSLSLDFPHPYDHHASLAWILDGCSFSLAYLSVSIPCDSHLIRFLQAQPNITGLCLRGLHTNPQCSLPPTCLPHLSNFRSVNADPSTLAGIIGGRPVEGVSISIRDAHATECLDALSMSSLPIKRLTLMSFDLELPNLLFAEVAKRMPELEALNIIVIQSCFTLVLPMHVQLIFGSLMFCSVP